jgi:hypothetical protein
LHQPEHGVFEAAVGAPDWNDRIDRALHEVLVLVALRRALTRTRPAQSART